MPHLNRVLFPGAFLDGLLGSLTLGKVPDREDYLVSVQSSEVASSFQTEAGIGTSDNDRLVREIFIRVLGSDEELRVQEAEKK